MPGFADRFSTLRASPLNPGPRMLAPLRLLSTAGSAPRLGTPLRRAGSMSRAAQGSSKGGTGEDSHKDRLQHDPVELADVMMEEGKHHVGKNLKDPEAIANRIMKEAARSLQHKEALGSTDHQIHPGSLAAEATSVAARKESKHPPEAAELVRGEVRAEYGTGAAEEVAEEAVEAAKERMARQPEEKRPHDLVGVLRDAESELTKEEVRAHGHVEKGSLASRVASAAERVAHGEHPQIAERVAEKLRQEGIIEEGPK